jgi:hypothetical protein
MVDVTDGPDVDVRLVALELLLRHFLIAPVSTCSPPLGRRTREIYLTAAAVGCPLGVDRLAGVSSLTVP